MKRGVLGAVSFIAVAGLLLIGTATSANAAPVTDTVDGLTFTADDSHVDAGATVTAYSGSSTDVTIPSTVTIAGTPYPVRSIGDNAFIHDQLTSVTIPNSVASIGDSAFYDNQLTSVTIPTSVPSIGVSAFGANLLTSVTIPSSVTSIGVNAFNGNLLTSVTIPSSVTSIEYQAFGGNQFLTSVTFTGSAPTTVGVMGLGYPGTQIYYLARFGSAVVSGGFTTPTWNGYPTQPQVTVGYMLDGHGTTIPNTDTISVDTAETPPSPPTASGYAFQGWFTAATDGALWDFNTHVMADTILYAQWNTNPIVTDTVDGLTFTADDSHVDAGATVTAYSGSSTDVTIPDTVTLAGTSYPVTSIGDNAFAFDGLTSVVIPNSVTSIGDSAFVFNELSSVVIPNSVTSIGDSAFVFNQLTSVSIPNSITSIGQSVFAANQLTSVSIPNSVTSIGNGAFQNNQLTSVIIPNSVTSIGDNAFFGNQLTSVTFAGSAPTTVGSSAFGSSSLQIYYLARFGSAVVSGGFTTPNWNGSPTQPQVTVGYMLDGRGTTFDTDTVSLGAAETPPLSDPTASGYTFQGWFTAATGGTVWDFTTRVMADTILYAQWVATVVTPPVTVDAPSSSTFSSSFTGALAMVRVTPPTSTVVAGLSQTFTASGADQYGNTIGDITTASTFAITPDGSCTANVCTASKSGAHTVTATDGSSHGTATLTVTAGPLAVVKLTPTTSTVTPDQSQTFTAIGADQYGNTIGDITTTSTFTITPDGSCTANVCSASNVGSHTVTATHGAAHGTSTLTVAPDPVATPTPAPVAVDTTLASTIKNVLPLLIIVIVLLLAGLGTITIIRRRS